MTTKILFFIISLIFVLPTFGQYFETDSTAQAEIQKLKFITGKWEGAGWMMGRDRVKREFNQTESVVFKLDSTAILIEGMGMADGEVIHNAMAVVSYDKEKGNYSFLSYLQSGVKGEFEGEIVGEKFYWYPNENMRYIIYLNDKNQWFEIGEIKNGDQWYQFFEMTLDRVK